MHEGSSYTILDSFLLFRNPDRTVLLLPDNDMSFDDLDRASSALAMMLIREGPDSVLIFLPFGSQFYVSLLACMRAGRAAVPMDPALPADLRKSQVERIGSALLLTDSSMKHDEFSCQRMLIVPGIADLIGSRDEREDVVMPTQIPDDLPLHHLFTSGSSGQQTLVTISRKAMNHDVSTTPMLYGLTDKHTLSNIGRYTSSLHINAFWRCMHVGASFMPVDLKTESSSDIISRWSRTESLMLQGHPSLMDVIFDMNAIPIPVESIRHLILGGEPLKGGWLTKLKYWLPCVERVSYNYSSTETMLIACRTFQMDQVDEMTRIPAGFPAPGKTVRILDESGTALSVGEVGEIFITSSFIGSSMVGPDAASRLQHDPVSGLRTWQTRDLGRWLPDGSIEHLGRADRQMKINGQRIDPVFIEQCIETIENINRSIVFSVRDMNDGQRLVAIYEGAEDVLPSMVRKALSERLPVGFIPTSIFRVDKIPVTHRGKPDFEALERIVHEQWCMNKVDCQHDLIDDASGIGSFLHQQWATLLPGGRCDPDRSIFDQGADSVMLLKMVSAISNRFGVQLNIGFLLQHITLNAQVSELVGIIKENSVKKTAEDPRDINLHFF